MTAWKPKRLLETFRYPRLGPGMMWDAARDFVVAKGNEVRMGHSFKQLAQDANGNWRLSATKADGSEAVIEAKHVISSAPMRELSARIHPLPQTFDASIGPEISRLPDGRVDDQIGRSVPR